MINIDELEKDSEFVIDRYIKQISKEVKETSDKLKQQGHPNYHIEARHIINLKYGKWWRERLELKKIYKWNRTEILSVELEDANADDKTLAITIIFKQYKQGFIAIEYKNNYSIFSNTEDAIKHIITIDPV